MSVSSRSETGAIAALGDDFWSWRHNQAPATRDDICRVIRPPGWAPRWSAADVVGYRERLAEFAARLAKIEPATAEVSERVDVRLLHSAIARVRWELDDVRNWATNPNFYVDQSLGAVFELLILRPPFDDAYAAELVLRLEAIPRVLAEGRENLADCAFREYAEIAVRELNGIVDTLQTVDRALRPLLPNRCHSELRARFATAGCELEAFAGWLSTAADDLATFEPVGRERFVAFLREVSHVSSSPEELAEIGTQEWRRAVWMEATQARLSAGRPTAYVAASAQEQVAIEADREQQVRNFYSRTGLLTIPVGLGHYHNLPMPDYLWPVRWLGVTDDLTDAHRLDEDAISYVPEPGPDLPYFHDTNARDPRIGIVHEGAHAMQLRMSWAGPNVLRREYYDSVANEGIAYYNEELTVTAGLFDDDPHSRRVMFNLMRLRALRVNVDIDLVLGNITIPEAGQRLRDLVPMDETTAFAEAGSFASTPGLGLSYVIGKHQILAWIADASLEQGRGFDLGALHDYLWRNGNVPIELLREEYAQLGGAAAAVNVERDAG